MAEYVMDYDGWAEGIPIGEYLKVRDAMHARKREEIVRCRDCKHARVFHPLNPITGVPAGIEVWRCEHFWNADELPEVEPDGFCAWGERK